MAVAVAEQVQDVAHGLLLFHLLVNELVYEIDACTVMLFISRNGDVEAIGTLNMETGELSFEGWYTLDGVRLDGKPNTKGIYINNGKKIVIK